MKEEKIKCRDCKTEIFVGQQGRCIYCYDMRIAQIKESSPEDLLKAVDKLIDDCKQTIDQLQVEAFVEWSKENQKDNQKEVS